MSVLAFQQIIASSSLTSSTESEKPYTFTALLIHGLLGSGDDFRDFAHSLASSLSNSHGSDWRMVLVDLRNHGSSVDKEGLAPPHDTENAARDLANLVKSRNWAWPDVIGHSLGGKVASQYAFSCARGDYGDSAQLPKQLWILDTVPGKVENKSHYQEVEKALDRLPTLPSQFPSQQWLVDHMIELGFPKFLSEWVSSSLKKSGEHETFSFSVEGALQMFKSAKDMDYWALLENTPTEMEVDIVRTESHVTWDPHVVERLKSLAGESEGKVRVHVVPRSGHWIYKDEPKRLLEIMVPRITSMVQELSEKSLTNF